MTKNAVTKKSHCILVATSKNLFAKFIWVVGVDDGSNDFQGPIIV